MNKFEIYVREEELMMVVERFSKMGYIVTTKKIRYVYKVTVSDKLEDLLND